MAIDEPKFSDELIIAINDWQAGSKDKQKKAGRLRELCKHLPSEFSVSPVVYRQIRVNGKLAAGIGSNQIPDAVSSWTTELDVARRFREDGNRKKVMVIFARMPKSEDVILNLNVVYRDPDFLVMVREAEERLQRKFLAVTKWGNDQNEVILEETVIENDQIVSVGAYRKLTDAIPIIGTPSQDAPSEDEIMKKLTGKAESEHFWTSSESAQTAVANAARKIRETLASRALWATTANTA